MESRGGALRMLLRRPIALIKASIALNKLTNQLLDMERPEAEKGSPRITKLTELASELAANGREDDQAVAELKAAAGWHRKDLRFAAAALRHRAWVGENLLVYRGNQLLLAAATGRPVKPVTEEQHAWFERVRYLTEVNRYKAFQRLTSLQPGLVDVVRTPETEDLAVAQERVRSALQPLVGPEADAEDQLVRSHTAYDIALEHLTTPAPFQLPATAGVLTGHTAAITAMTYAYYNELTGIITGSDDHTARIWDLHTSTLQETLTGHTDSVTAVGYQAMIYAPDGRHLPRVAITGSADRTARVWDMGTGASLHTLAGHTAPLTAVASWMFRSVRPDQSLELLNLAVTTSLDGTARIWDLSTAPR